MTSSGVFIVNFKNYLTPFSSASLGGSRLVSKVDPLTHFCLIRTLDAIRLINKARNKTDSNALMMRFFNILSKDMNSHEVTVKSF